MRSTSHRQVLYFDRPHGRVGRDDGGAEHVLPLCVRRGSVEETLPLLWRQCATGGALALRQVLHVIRERSPSAARFEHARQHADVHVDRAVPDAGLVPRAWELGDRRFFRPSRSSRRASRRRASPSTGWSSSSCHARRETAGSDRWVWQRAPNVLAVSLRMSRHQFLVRLGIVRTGAMRSQVGSVPGQSVSRPGKATGETIAYEVQLDAVLEQCLRSSQNKRKAFSGAHRQRGNFSRTAAETRIGDAHECRAIGTRDK